MNSDGKFWIITVVDFGLWRHPCGALLTLDALSPLHGLPPGACLYSGPFEYRRNRAQQDLEVQAQAPILYVLQVERNIVVK